MEFVAIIPNASIYLVVLFVNVDQDSPAILKHRVKVKEFKMIKQTRNQKDSHLFLQLNTFIFFLIV